jgi:hypothetical protein
VGVAKTQNKLRNCEFETPVSSAEMDSMRILQRLNR